MLLCDFHIHTTWSDGSVPLRDVVDIYGQAGFDVIAITDHIHNKDGVIRAWAERDDIFREATGQGALVAAG